MLRKANDTSFKTGTTAAYPPAMNNTELSLVQDMLAVRELAPTDGERLTQQVGLMPSRPAEGSDFIKMGLGATSGDSSGRAREAP